MEKNFEDMDILEQIENLEVRVKRLEQKVGIK